MASAIDTVRKELDDVQKQLDGYEDLVKHRVRLTQALRALEGQSIAPAANATPAAGRPTRASRARSSREPIHEDKIIHACLAHGGPIAATDIRYQLGLSDDQSNALSIVLKRMVDEGKLVRQGERRASRYIVPGR